MGPGAGRVARIRSSLGQAALAGAAACVFTAHLPGYALGAAPLVVNGAVHAMARSGDKLYLGGRFLEVGPRTGPGVVLDLGTGGARRHVAIVGGPAPRVRAVVPDGRGGWYVGGSFRRVGGVRVRNLARVRASGGVDRRFRPNPDGRVLTLARRGSTVYAGGLFRRIGGRGRRAVAALSTRSGKARVWNARIRGPSDFGPEVHALALSRGRLYVGGSYVSAGGRSRSGIAAVRAGSGRLLRWKPHVDGLVSAIAVSGRTVYLGGAWSIAPAGLLSESLRAFDARTARATRWRPSLDSDNPQAQAEVGAIAPTSRGVIVAGSFDEAGGSRRSNLAAIDRRTGRATAFDPRADGSVSALRLSRRTLYVAGSFARIGGQRRRGLAAVRLADGRVTSWDPRPNRSVLALALARGRLYAGGAFSSIGAEPRRRLAALDARSGALLPWNPGADGSVDALVVRGGTVFAGGEFRHVGGRRRPLVAALDERSGTALAWDARAGLADDYGIVRALALSGQTLYVGGTFGALGGQRRAHLGAVDALTGVATRFNPTPDEGNDDSGALGGGIVQTLLVTPHRVYAGGVFFSIGGGGGFLAALDPMSGRRLPWTPKPNGDVYALAKRGNALYVGGAFTRLGGSRRRRLGAVSVRTARATRFNPRVGPQDRNVEPDSEINALAVSAATVYAGGRYRSIGGARRHGLAALSGRSGRARRRFRAQPDRSVLTLLAGSRNLFAGGAFSYIGGQERVAVSALDRRTGRGRWGRLPRTTSCC